MALVITGGASPEILNITVALGPMPVALLADIAVLVDPAIVGIPEIRPVTTFNVNPAGSGDAK